MTFREYLAESKTNSVKLKTKKTAIKSVDVIKYKDGSYGILNFSMQSDNRKFLIDNGFKYDSVTHYPYKNIKSKDDTIKTLKNMFGINTDLNELDKE